MSHYVTDNRVLIQAIEAACLTHRITATYFSDKWVIKLQKGDHSHLIYAHSIGLNSDASSRVAADKVATHELLAGTSIPSVPHFLLSSIIDPVISPEALNQLLEKYNDLVIKPLHGHSGQHILRSSDVNKILRFTDSHQHSGWAASPYIDIRREIRLVILRGEIVLAYEKLNPMLFNGLKLYNLHYGATARTIEKTDISPNFCEMAHNAAQSIGLDFAAVDIIVDDSGTVLVLEVNTAFGLEHYAQQSTENFARAKQLYEGVISSLFTVAE